MKNSKNIIPALCLLTLVSCGGDSGGSSNNNHNNGATNPGPNEEREEIQEVEGTYKAILRPYNFNLSGFIPNGVTDIKISGDDIQVSSWLDDSANVTHMQNIHVGTKCPEPEHDTNKDGYVDMMESMNVSGKILIPLDSDISAQEIGGVYPKGNFTYFQKVSLAEMMNDLQQLDPNPADHTAKLATNNALNLAGRVIIVMGAKKTLPGTVSSFNGQAKELSVPIACGIIERMPEEVIAQD